MTKKETNPLETMVTDFSDDYVEVVNDIAEELAPARPWWHKQLGADEKLWRWLPVREKVMPWLLQVGAMMGAKDAQAVMDMLPRIFTDEAIVQIVSPALVVQIPIELLELVKTAGPQEAAKHIRQMERLVVARTAAEGVMENSDQPEITAEAPPAPPQTTEEAVGEVAY